MEFRALHPPTSEGFLSPQSTDEEGELRSVTVREDDLYSQSSWSPTEGDNQTPWSGTEEDLESYVSATKEEYSTTEEGSDVATPLESFHLTSIWNVAALEQYVMGMRARFQWRDTRAIAHSPDASSSSSPLYEYAYGSASTNDENNDQYLQFTSFDILDYDCVNLIDASSLARVGDMIRQCQIVEPVNPQFLYQVFEENSAMLDSYLYDHFTSAGLSIDKWICMNASEFTYQSANDCVMILRISTRLLCLMLHNLAEAECESFDQDLRAHYFVLCAGRLVENLIKAADSISNLRWPASHICQMLVLYKAIDDVLHAIDCPSESERIFQQMRLNFKGIFDGIKFTICEYLKDPQHTIVQVVHPVTDFFVRSMELFTIHSSTIQDTCIGKSSSSVDHHLSKVISHWAEQLGICFMSYTEGRNYTLILNNLTHFDDEMRISPNSESGCTLKSLIDINTSNYLVECWGSVRDCVTLISGVKPCWSSLDAFTLQFNTVYDRQKMWVLKTQLKRRLREQIDNFLVPYYDEFLKKLQNRTYRHFRFSLQKHKYITTEELRSKVQGMFKTEHKE